MSLELIAILNIILPGVISAALTIAGLRTRLQNLENKVNDHGKRIVKLEKRRGLKIDPSLQH